MGFLVFFYFFLFFTKAYCSWLDYKCWTWAKGGIIREYVSEVLMTLKFYGFGVLICVAWSQPQRTNFTRKVARSVCKPRKIRKTSGGKQKPPEITNGGH